MEKTAKKGITYYITQPEFRPVFYLTPLLIILVVVQSIYLPTAWMLISIAAVVVIIAILVAASWRLSTAHAEVKLRHKQMESIISHLSVGVIAYDTDFVVSVFNPAAEEIFGIGGNEVVAKTLSTQMGSDIRYQRLAQTVFSSLASKVMKHSAPGEYPQIMDISFQDPQLDLRVITDRILNNKGEAEGFIKLITNRTREMELLQSKTEFISVAAHQLRTPLTAINWSLEAISKSEHLDNEEKELAHTGFRAAKNMLKIVNDLLDVSKMEEGRFGYQFEEVDLVKFLEGILAESNTIAKQYGIALYFQRPQEAITGVIDTQKMSMALFNLIDNAIKYNVEHGEVTVGLSKTDNPSFVQVTVKDTGIGMSQEDVAHVFEKFYRSQSVTDHVPDGTGLGLYIVKNIVTRHGGEITVESEANRGSTFTLTIPTAQAVIPKKDLTEF